MVSRKRPVMSEIPLLALLFLILSQICHAQLITENVAQVKILNELFPVSNAQQINQITWTILGKTPSEIIYCVSEPPVSQLRFVCVDCAQKNITDMVNVLNSAQDLTRNAGFPTVSLKNIDVNPAWTGATIMCQAAINGGTIDSAPVTVNVEYLKNVHVVDSNNQSPVRIPNQGNVFYVECVRGADGQCQQTGRRKTLNCAVQANPPPVSFRWLKNGEITSGNGAEITIGTEMIGKSIQCSANNGLYPHDEMPTSQAVSIEPYSAARLIQTNFRNIQTTAPFSAGNRIEMNQALKLTCVVEGNPRPIVFWRMRRANGLVVDAPCPQGYDGQLHEITNVPGQSTVANNNLLQIHATCELHISDYSYTGQYWCSACSYVSYGNPECSPTLDAPGNEVLNMQVQGPPMQSDALPSVEQIGQNTAVVTVHFCADPMPRPPREIVFSVDGNDIQLGQSSQNFRFDSTTQNNTVPNCYFARLQISPVHDGDKHKQIILKLQNQYGAKQIIVSLADLLGDGTVHDSIATIVMGVILGLIGVGIIAVIGVICCMRRRMCCFSGEGFEGVKEYGNPSSTHNIKPTIGAPESYNGGSAGQHAFYADHALEVIHGEAVYVSKEAQTHLTSQKSSHEGINFAEMNLTDRKTPSFYGLPLSASPRHPQESGGLTPDYYLRQQQSQLASTISVNSVV